MPFIETLSVVIFNGVAINTLLYQSAGCRGKHFNILKSQRLVGKDVLDINILFVTICTCIFVKVLSEAFILGLGMIEYNL